MGAINVPIHISLPPLTSICPRQDPTGAIASGSYGGENKKLKEIKLNKKVQNTGPLLLAHMVEKIQNELKIKYMTIGTGL